eukprot:3846504-Prymnesium_polylepis.1
MVSLQWQPLRGKTTLRLLSLMRVAMGAAAATPLAALLRDTTELIALPAREPRPFARARGHIRAPSLLHPLS